MMNSDTQTEPAGTADGDEDALAVVATPPLPVPANICSAGTIEPLVRVREDHNISRRDIDPDALKVLYRLSRNKYIAYLVGGGVRDLLLGRRPKDFDVATNARPEQIRALFRNCILIGRRFRLAHVRYGDKVIETSTLRRSPECAADPNDPEADLFQRDDNLFGTPQEDALRRDFTVNGLFYDIDTFSIIDYVGGMEDLAAKRIRAIGDPNIRFREDPVRMVRAVRFASRLDFTIESETLEAIRRHGDELAKASPARLLEEICRLFAFSSGERAMRLLEYTDLLRVILPEVAECLQTDPDSGLLFWKRLRALDEGDTVLPDATPALIFSTLLADPLKRKLFHDWSSEDFPRLKFDRIHAFLEPLSQRLRFPRKLVDRIVHMFLAQHRFAHSGGKRGSIANFVTQDSFHESLALAEILHTAEARPQTRLNQWRDMLAERIYGREEGGGQSASSSGSGSERRQFVHGGNNGTNGNNNGGNGGNGSNGNGSAGETERRREVLAEENDGDISGKRLSRSARRRRNKKIKRLRTQDERPVGQGQEADIDAPEESAQEAANVSAVGERPGTELPAIPTETAPPESVAAAASASPAASVPAANGENGSGRKPSRSRNRRGRSRNRGDASEASAPVEPARPAAPVDEPEQPMQTLTAAAFYAPPPEPEKKRGGRKSSKPAAGKRAPKANGGEDKPSSSDSARIKETPPPAMDRADEADIPMHWLDEI